MKITNEFDVGVPLAQTWTTMLDVPRVARALPGAKIDPAADGGVYRGTMKIKLGPVTTAYAGTARIEDVDDDDHVARFRVEGREARGQGGAAATIELRLSESARDGTRVVVITDMQVTGRQAQFGRGLMEEVAGAILADFAKRLERELRGEGGGDAGGPGGGASAGASGGGAASRSNGASSSASPFDDADEALDVSSAVRGPLLQRAAMVGGGALGGLLLGLLIGLLAGRGRGARAAAAPPWATPPAGWVPPWAQPPAPPSKPCRRGRGAGRA